MHMHSLHEYNETAPLPDHAMFNEERDVLILIHHNWPSTLDRTRKPHRVTIVNYDPDFVQVFGFHTFADKDEAIRYAGKAAGRY
jgi:hypothetical protein